MSHDLSPTRAAIQRETLEYLNAARRVLDDPENTVKTTSTCTECDKHVSDMGVEWMAHWVMINAAADEPVVVIGCEGYWIVDPTTVGIKRDHWAGIEGVNI